MSSHPISIRQIAPVADDGFFCQGDPKVDLLFEVQQGNGPIKIELLNERVNYSFFYIPRAPQYQPCSGNIIKPDRFSTKYSSKNMEIIWVKYGRSVKIRVTVHSPINGGYIQAKYRDYYSGYQSSSINLRRIQPRVVSVAIDEETEDRLVLQVTAEPPVCISEYCAIVSAADTDNTTITNCSFSTTVVLRKTAGSLTYSAGPVDIQVSLLSRNNQYTVPRTFRFGYQAETSSASHTVNTHAEAVASEDNTEEEFTKVSTDQPFNTGSDKPANGAGQSHLAYWSGSLVILMLNYALGYMMQ